VKLWSCDSSTLLHSRANSTEPVAEGRPPLAHSLVFSLCPWEGAAQLTLRTLLRGILAYLGHLLSLSTSLKVELEH